MKAQNVLPVHESLAVLPAEKEKVRAETVIRVHYIDNIRLFLTILVILHHIMIIYAGSGGWIYQEEREDVISFALGSWFTSVNHSYFMGLFFLISAYFVPGSYDRKGARKFLQDRLVRLGLPLAVYSWIIRPALIFAGNSSDPLMSLSFLEWYFQRYFRDYGIIGGGPLWFISALLIFSFFYVLWRKVTQGRFAIQSAQIPFPKNLALVLFAMLLGCAAFVTRIWFPADALFEPLNFQLADFPQYILLFCIGLAAYRLKWLESMPEKTGRAWLVVSICLICMFPPMAIFGGALEDAAPFKGGLHWQAFLTAEWQAFLCVSMCLNVITIFRRRYNHQGALGRYLSRNAYSAYLIHEPVITYAALGFAGVMLYPLIKFALLALVAIPLCFVLSSLIRKLPYADRVL